MNDIFSFQNDAVAAVERDFTNKPTGRFLIVIPTAGGKTRVAARSVFRLFRCGVLHLAQHRVLWVAHRQELLDQARRTFEVLVGSDDEHTTDVVGQVDFQMLKSASERGVMHTDAKLVIIDEAHHGAASSYQPFFQRKDLGVLGLTATPTRFDGKPLDFERESYSIGFPDLVKKGVILRPEIETIVSGETITIESLPSVTSREFDTFDIRARNELIISHLIRNVTKYNKIVVFVGTIRHVKSIWNLMRSSELMGYYKGNINYVTGNENSRNLSRQEFVAIEQALPRSILVNVNVLSEGYDDPSIDAVVMAAPTRSKLYYMQAVGRAVRRDPTNPLKTPTVVEVVDDLPNIRYRIDNRWLYSDISDALEPRVEDHEVGSEREFASVLSQVFEKYDVSPADRAIPRFDPNQRYSMLLFKEYRGPDSYGHRCIVLDNSSRVATSNAFNFVAERAEAWARARVNFSHAAGATLAPLQEHHEKAVLEAMENAARTLSDRTETLPDWLSLGAPWLTFISIHFRQPTLPAGLLDFVEGMINKDDVCEQIARRDFEPGAVLLRFPEPLVGYVGRVLNATTYSQLRPLVDRLLLLRDSSVRYDQFAAVRNLLDDAVLPVELVFRNSIVTAVRERVEFEYRLDEV